MLASELSGIFLGVLARAFFPWVRKLRSGKVVHFSKRYLYSAIGSVIAGMIVTLLIFPKFEVASIGQGAEASVRLFAMAFGFGFGWHAIVDEVAKWAGAFKDVEKKE
jgi:formate/nitrite transporter FocA (FNT family)